MTFPNSIKEFVLGAVLAVAIGLSSLVFFFYGAAIDAWWRQNWWIVALGTGAISLFLIVWARRRARSSAHAIEKH